MKKPEIKMTVIKEESGYSASAQIGQDFIGTQGESFDELKNMILEAVNLAFEDKGEIYSIEEIKLEYDLESFFSFYKVINVKELSHRIGMNQSLLSQYINGIKKPSQAQTKRIVNGIRQIGIELSEVALV
jgi:hypothetical protein